MVFPQQDKLLKIFMNDQDHSYCKVIRPVLYQKVNFLLAINITIIDVNHPFSIEGQGVLLQKP
jgi:hypothetical protein